MIYAAGAGHPAAIKNPGHSRITITSENKETMKLKTAQHKNRLFFILAVITCFSSVRQAGVEGASSLSFEVNPASRRGCTIVFSPPKTRVAWWRPRVLFDSCKFVAGDMVPRDRDRNDDEVGCLLRSARIDLAGYPARMPLVETPARKDSTKV